ncbi:hypothetical protein FZI85_17760 [Mycobacterium sp. CBMA293]|uniref:hypothetical protein n=1 Tax=unclassified Mycolicibacterium TaxID=2636767 RepID=UPI0012DF9474|nr:MULTISPECIES: hypothetical protein [unclassified Mycolicibacterium]MUL44565.1 hypothetical protein [Mycolicibacterium sp. CBMA 360]MUL59887.1 hypothetical protein [Mycolicibacterium sp. CBMA 335]MUL68730.1 hypothetical protein [Mycolicibacterium sp. CBMA 311]MUL93879.1 hypothetical protein [Mycolicibacterium sp. CBMA 230]MUM06124.1 hypothetical protein [Mycolicibacterium sp. CBMA 213]
MRFVATLLLWLVTTVAVAVAVPVCWAQHTIVDRGGYVALATTAAKNPELQKAAASELGIQINKLATSAGYDLSTSTMSNAAGIYTSSSEFPDQFGTANGLAHDWLFTDTMAHSDASGRWTIDLSPMLSDRSFKATLSVLGVRVPSKIEVPLTDSAQSLRPGQFRAATTWGPWARVGICVLTGLFALLTLAMARSRGKTLAALGISTMIVGAAGWAGIEVGRRYINDGLNRATGNVRQVADIMVDQAIANAHQWLNITLAVGGGLVVAGVLVTLLGSLGRRVVRKPAATPAT